MISDLRLAELAEAVYDRASLWDREWRRGDVRFGSLVVDGEVAIVARGTRPRYASDWRTDFSAWPAYHPTLGFCPAGFLLGAESVAQQAIFDIAERYHGLDLVFAGHSLGGAFALQAGGLLCDAGRPPARIVTFGAPRAGCGKLRRLLAVVKELRQYRHAGDPVPLFPTWPYHHARPMIQLGRAWPLLIEDHAIAAYQRAIGANATLTRQVIGG